MEARIENTNQYESKTDIFIHKTQFGTLTQEEQQKKLQETREYSREIYLKIFEDGKGDDFNKEIIEQFKLINEDNNFPSEQKVALAESLEWYTDKIQNSLHESINKNKDFASSTKYIKLNEKYSSLKQHLSKERKEILIKSLGNKAWRSWDIIAEEDPELFNSISDLRLDDTGTMMQCNLENNLIILPGENSTFFKKLIKISNDNIEIFSEKLGWSKEKVTANYKLIAFLHEIGHAKDLNERNINLETHQKDTEKYYELTFLKHKEEFIKKYNHIESPLFNRLKEKESLSNEEWGYYITNATGAEEEFFQDLITIYKNHHTEKKADEFAINFIKQYEKRIGL